MISKLEVTDPIEIKNLIDGLAAIASDVCKDADLYEEFYLEFERFLEGRRRTK